MFDKQGFGGGGKAVEKNEEKSTAFDKNSPDPGELTEKNPKGGIFFHSPKHFSFFS